MARVATSGPGAGDAATAVKGRRSKRAVFHSTTEAWEGRGLALGKTWEKALTLRGDPAPSRSDQQC